jgi:GNAT superfamily N-acetyltransferase
MISLLPPELDKLAPIIGYQQAEEPILQFDGVEVTLRFNPNEPEWLDILLVESQDRGKGKASAAINSILAYADEHNLNCSVYAKQCEGSTMNTLQIADWYARHGFKDEGYRPKPEDLDDPDHCGVDMWRSPR